MSLPEGETTSTALLRADHLCHNVEAEAGEPQRAFVACPVTQVAWRSDARGPGDSSARRERLGTGALVLRAQEVADLGEQLLLVRRRVSLGTGLLALAHGVDRQHEHEVHDRGDNDEVQ